MKPLKSLLLGAVVIVPLTGLLLAAKAPQDKADSVARGKYLVTIAACNDCHTPVKMGPKGPEPDLSRWLSGHPADAHFPPPPKLGPGPWFASVGAFTAWSGPWGSAIPLT